MQGRWSTSKRLLLVRAPAKENHKSHWQQHANAMIVLVRRVVEARRLTASGGASNALQPVRTAALTPMNDNAQNSSDSSAEKGHGDSPSIWKKLRCW